MSLIRKTYRNIRYHPYFYLMLPVGLVIASILNYLTNWAWSTILLTSWNSAIGLYLIRTFAIITHYNQKHIAERAEKQDENKWVILLLVCLAVSMCLYAIIIHLSHLPSVPALKYAHILLALGTIAMAWLFMHTVFAVHYAHAFYIAKNHAKEPGLEFPKTPMPVYFDFIYFSYVIGTASQTADVSITSKKMRILNTFHLMLAFTFNTIILAICINIAASLITS
ncbi:DUF1345 domain-containing protein [Acinetobacter nectaris]|uniref:DUF1345 domain-containing protein n=1 Tax=Acinetobacter nectaris TaxID=1219382 RepID=UPI001F420492|nr:DUF1345 domain-containing protein [Acinetobacter nectaris]MCF8998411.1 DUF1345 domain-containing protein [Acinetobacter nectaris]MCF9028394.1 DUF1345 domain-containing protein [Acinetobacter nectaris]